MTQRFAQRRRKHLAARRRGIVLVVVIVAVSVSLTLFGLWTRNLIREHQRFALQQYRVQATRLAEAGLRRAVARKAADEAFQEEIWTVPADALNGTHSASVRIRVTSIDEGAGVRYEAIAQFPADAERRSQVTKQLEVPNSNSETEP